jgi:hypothetical protein
MIEGMGAVMNSAGETHVPVEVEAWLAKSWGEEVSLMTKRRVFGEQHMSHSVADIGPSMVESAMIRGMSLYPRRSRTRLTTPFCCFSRR